MAAEGRTNPAPLSETILKEPQGFEFFQLVRLFSRLNASRKSFLPDPVPGNIRFRSSVSLAFPTGDVKRVEPDPLEEDAYAITVAFMGLADRGGFGSLPTHYTELLLHEAREERSTLRDFLDLFNHRFVSLFYRAWAKHNPAMLIENNENPVFEKMLLSLAGMRPREGGCRRALPEQAMLTRAGQLTRRPTSLVSLESMLASYFRVRAELVQFVPKRYAVSRREQTRLGMANSVLGSEPVLGETVCFRHSSFRVKLGPMDWKQYQEFLPTGKGLKPLVEMIRMSVGLEFDFDVKLVLQSTAVPELELAAGRKTMTRLGWSTWLTSRPMKEDPSDAVVDGEGENSLTESKEFAA